MLGGPTAETGPKPARELELEAELEAGRRKRPERKQGSRQVSASSRRGGPLEEERLARRLFVPGEGSAGSPH